MLRTILFVTALSFTTAGHAKDVELRLKPSSPWNAQYEDESCRLVRTFGSGKRSITAIFNRFDPGDEFQLILAGTLVKKAKKAGKAKFRFGPTEEFQESSFRIRSLNNGTPALLITSRPRIAAPTSVEKEKLNEADINNVVKLPPLSKSQLSAVNFLHVDHPFSEPLFLELGSMGGPFESLSTCIDDLLTSWGISADKHRNLSASAKPVGNAGDWVNAIDMPNKLRGNGFSTIVRFRLIVDTEGRVSSCHIQNSNHPELSKLTCSLITDRAKFKPALDSDGNPIKSYWRNAVWWGSPPSATR